MTPRPTAAVALFAVLVLVAGCARYAGGLTKPPLNTVHKVALVRYDCKSGAQIQASYPKPETAVVVYKGKSHHMTIARSADGARYTGDNLEWWTKGSGSGSQATLFAHRDGAAADNALEHCRQTSLAQ